MAESLNRRIFSYTAIEILAKGESWLTLFVLAALLKPAEYGVVGLLIGVEALVGDLLLFGHDRAILRYQAGTRDSGVLRTAGASLLVADGFLLAVVVLLLLFAGRPTIVGIPMFPHLMLILLSLIPLNQVRLRLASARAGDRVDEYGRLRLLHATLKLGAVVVLAGVLAASEAYAIGAVCAAVVAVLASRSCDHLRRIRLEMPAVRRIWRFGWPFMFHVLAGSILMFTDRFMLQVFTDPTAVGAYVLAYTLGASVGFASLSLGLAMEPTAYRHGERPSVREAWLERFLVMALATTASAALVLVALSPAGVTLIFGPAYASIVGLVPIVAAAHVLHAVYLQANYRLLTAEATGALVIGSSTAAVANVFLNLALIPTAGPRGAAIATFLSYSLLAGFTFFSSLSASRSGLGLIGGKRLLMLAGVLLTLVVFTQQRVLQLLAFGLLAGVGILNWRGLGRLADARGPVSSFRSG